ncbi:MAG: 16S rRNA (guanine(527)-N(7))-methyltransferase RsmG [Gammaproteobacteria bacterium]
MSHAGSSSRIEFSDRAVPPAIRPALEAFAGLLLEWNRAYNLVGSGASQTIWTHHILDSLAVVSLLEGSTVVDIGSGAGFPGLVLAIACPSRQFVLVDANGKKTRFLGQAKRQLKLANLEIVHARAEGYGTMGSRSPGTLIARALGSIAYFLDVSEPLAGPGAQWLAMKGRIPHEEMESLPKGYRVERLWQIRIEGLAAERHVIDLRRVDSA